MPSDNVIPWPGAPHPKRDDEPAAGPDDARPLARPLSSAQREAARALARIIAAGPDAETNAETGVETGTEMGPERVAAEGGGDWRAGLDPAEAWEVAAAVRRSLTPGPTGPHARLDRELQRLAGSECDRLVTHHRQLLVDVSHDLRSPLNSVLFLADALQSERSGPLRPQQLRQVSVLYTAAVTLVRLVNDLIDYARLGDGHAVSVASVAFSPGSVWADVANLVGPLVTHRRVSLEARIEAEDGRSGDPQILSRILLNLVSNAVEAVEDGGGVTVEIRGGREALDVRVRDDRLGTDLGELRRRLDEAGDMDGRTTTRGWTRGLGLTICARLARAAGGTVNVAAIPGEGTEFRVILPFPVA
ncbi:MAG: HAMP domain-containing sensor histidine kinase [Gemmatimonadota bacterium]|nr:HAMP domain-containing sensor histidine kinase [Gemmatimonadota bacterium]